MSMITCLLSHCIVVISLTTVVFSHLLNVRKTYSTELLDLFGPRAILMDSTSQPFALVVIEGV